MCYDDINFKCTPNFIYKETISTKSDCLSNCCTFDYFLTKSQDLILVTPYINISNYNDESHSLSLINLKTNKIEGELTGHTDRILSVRIFKNPKTKKNYIISVDKGLNVIVWDIEKNFEIIFNKKFEYHNFTLIYSTLMIFDENNNNIWVVVSSIDEKNKTLVANLNKSSNNYDDFIEIKNSENLPVYCLCYWYNNEAENDEEKHNIIQCGKNKILISKFPKNETYYIIDTDEKYMYNSGGLVYKIKDKNFLAISSCSGLILIFDLIEKNIIKKIELDDVHIFSFIKWNENYLLLNDTQQKRIIVMDIDNDYEINSMNLLPQMEMDVYMKKIKHPLYDECIITSGKNWKLNLFIIRGIQRKNNQDKNFFI